MPPQSSADLAKKYGGSAVADLASKYGGTPVTAEAAPAQTPAAAEQKPQGFFENLWAGINPIPLIKTLGDVDGTVDPKEAAMLRGAGAPPGLGNVIRGIVGAQHGEWQKAQDAYSKGNYGDAIMYALSTGVPLAGPMATNFGETVKSGDYAGAAGQVAAIAGPAALSKAKIAPRAIGKMANANPQESLALQYAASQGVPMDAGTVTGSPVVRGAQYLADRTLAAGPSVNRAQEAQTTALRATLGELADKAGPSQTAESAGRAIQQGVSGKVSDLHAEATAAYDDLRAIAARNVKPVQTGVKDSASGLVKGAQPVMEPMAFPVDLKSVKAALKPVWERMRRQMPVTQQQASPGLKAIENIMTGPDVESAAIVDLDLSAIKAIARGADRPELRDVGQGLAANAVKQLDDAVKAAVQQGGQPAMDALMKGRNATRAKYLAAEVEDGLRAEPVKAFRQATEPKDAAIMQLRELQRLAPTELPKIGRAFLDDLMQTATKEGGFDKTGTIAERWSNLGPQTKKLLFADPRLVTQLDRFFIAAKKLTQNPNPSGSGGMVQIGSQGALALFNPALAVTQQLGGLALSKAMRNPKFIQLLTDGITIKPGSVTSKAWLAAITPFLKEGAQ